MNERGALDDGLGGAVVLRTRWLGACPAARRMDHTVGCSGDLAVWVGAGFGGRFGVSFIQPFLEKCSNNLYDGLSGIT